MTSTISVSLGQRLQRGLIAALFWTPVFAPILYVITNAAMQWLGFTPESLPRATFLGAVVVFSIHSISAPQLAAEADNRVDRIIHDPALSFGEKLATISKDRLGGALTIYLPLYVAILLTVRL